MGFFTSTGCIIATFSFSVIFFVLAGVIPVVIDNKIESEVKNKIQLIEDNDDWKQTPGNLGIRVVRDFIVMEFQNKWDAIFGGEKPVFKETEPHRFKEYREFADRTYEQDEEIVNFNFYQHFEPTEGTTGDEEVTVFKMGPLAAWDRAKKNPIYSLSLSALSGTIQTFDKTLLYSVLGSTIGTLITTNDPTLTQLATDITNAGYSGDVPTLVGAIMQDTRLGFSSSNGNKFWMKVILKGLDDDNNLEQVDTTTLDNDDFDYLLDYYNIDAATGRAALDYFFGYANTGWTGSLKAALADPAAAMNVPVNKFMTAVQFTTLQVLGGSSAGELSDTVMGYVELKAYFDNVFTVYNDGNNPYFVSNATSFFTLDTFDTAWALQALEYIDWDPTVGEYIKEPYALCNVGNQGVILSALQQYAEAGIDASEIPNFAPLTAVKEQFELNSNFDSLILANYLYYMGSEVAKRASIGGNESNAAAGTFAAGGIENTFALTEQLLKTAIYPMMAQGAAAANEAINTCLKHYTLIVGDVAATALCGDAADEPHSLETFQSMLFVCRGAKAASKAAAEAAGAPIDTLCNAATIGFNALFQNVDTSVQAVTGASCPYGMCSNFDLAMAQWYKGAVTKNLSILTGDAIPNLPSIYDLLPLVAPQYAPLVPARFEFYAAVQEIAPHMNIDENEDSTHDNQFNISYETLKPLLSGERFINKSIISEMFVRGYMNPTLKEDYFVDELGLALENVDQILNFYRYLIFEVSFGGITITTDIKSAMQGYDDEFLEKIKYNDPQNGGNPSTFTFVRLNEPSMTREDSKMFYQKMFTGKNNHEMTREYVEIFGASYIAGAGDVWDGYNVTYVDGQSVWEKEIPIMGTDGGQTHPFQEEGDKINVHIFSTYFSAELEQKEKVDFHGMDAFKYTLPDSQLTHDDKPDQWFNGPSGLINLTQARTAPVFSSKTHFYNADQSLADAVTILNKDGNVQGASEYDDTYVISEKLTGASLSVQLNLQINYEMKPDILFPVDETIYMPAYYMNRGLNWTEPQVDEKFKDLKTGQMFFWLFLILFASLGGVCLIMGVVQIIQRKKSLKKIENQEKVNQDKNLQPAFEELPQTQKQINTVENIE